MFVIASVQRRYLAYGVAIRSAYRLTLPRTDSTGLDTATPEIILEPGCGEDFADALAQLREQVLHEGWFHYLRLADGSDYLRWPKLFEFLVAPDGRHILAHRLARVGFETLQTYLLSQVLSFALLRLGIETLHGTTLAVGSGAVTFLGDCGYGKSTLAAAFVNQGYRLLTDDMLAVKQIGSDTLAYPGLPCLKLMPRTARALLGHFMEAAPINPFTCKRVIRLNHTQVASTPRPLRAVYALKPPQKKAPQRITIQKLTGQKAWQALTCNTYNPSARNTHRLEEQFAWAANLAQQLPVKSLSYPRSLRVLPQVVEQIVSDAFA